MVALVVSAAQNRYIICHGTDDYFTEIKCGPGRRSGSGSSTVYLKDRTTPECDISGDFSARGFARELRQVTAQLAVNC
jgi:hypothetical protein